MSAYNFTVASNDDIAEVAGVDTAVSGTSDVVVILVEEDSNVSEIMTALEAAKAAIFEFLAG